MKITVMGPGGVGGYFGARLAAAGNDVTFVARGAHLEAMRKDGLRLDSEIGKLHLKPVKVVADARDVDAADVVIFAVKMRDTESAAEHLRGLVAKGAAVFTFQNGVESAERIGRIVGRENVVPGAARIAANISAPGVISQIGKFALIEFGEPDGKPSARTAGFHDACKRAGIDATLSGNISRTLWAKFAMLAPFSGMTALTRGPIGPIRRNPQSRALLQAAVEEAVAVGIALKTGLNPDDVGKTMKLIDGLPNEMMASMCHDLLAGKPIELDGLSGAVARLGRQAGVPVPTHTFIAQALALFAEGKPAA
ncbi:MAG: 2-dehydropantoate 2-reductase [Hyphomicrobiaceae bacterium]|nr:MAG: 2-dehydropantoate 2-reductase [Hyphomicrobiaceae bacterium]